LSVKAGRRRPKLVRRYCCPSSSAATAARRHSHTAWPALAIVGHRARARTQAQACVHGQARGPAHSSPQISAAKLQKRIAEFPDSFLVVKAGYLYLFCLASKCAVTYHKWAARQHFGTDKQIVSAEKLQRRAAADQSIKEAIAEHFDKQPNLVRANAMTILPELQAFRYNVTETFPSS
jgi:hypothetical protein